MPKLLTHDEMLKITSELGILLYDKTKVNAERIQIVAMLQYGVQATAIQGSLRKSGLLVSDGFGGVDLHDVPEAMEMQKEMNKGKELK